MRIILLSLIVAALSGCASLTGNSDAKLIVQYSALKACDTPAKASRCVEIATEVRDFANTEQQLSVALLIQAIEEEINWTGLDPADQLLVRALTQRLQAGLVDYLSGRLGVSVGVDDVLPADVRLAASTVADWTIEVLSF